jgi:hypothetical protein
MPVLIEAIEHRGLPGRSVERPESDYQGSVSPR